MEICDFRFFVFVFCYQAGSAWRQSEFHMQFLSQAMKDKRKDLAVLNLSIPSNQTYYYYYYYYYYLLLESFWHELMLIDSHWSLSDIKPPQISKTFLIFPSVLNNVVRGSLNKFPDFFRMGTFIDSTHTKL